MRQLSSFCSVEIEFVVTKWVYAALCASAGGVISQAEQRNIRVGPSHRLNKCLVATTASRATGGVPMQLGSCVNQF